MLDGAKKRTNEFFNSFEGIFLWLRNDRSKLVPTQNFIRMVQLSYCFGNLFGQFFKVSNSFESRFSNGEMNMICDSSLFSINRISQNNSESSLGRLGFHLATFHLGRPFECIYFKDIQHRQCSCLIITS